MTWAELSIRGDLIMKADFVSALPFGMEVRVFRADEPVYQYVYDLNARPADEVSEIIRGINSVLPGLKTAVLSDSESKSIEEFLKEQTGNCRTEWKKTFDMGLA